MKMMKQLLAIILALTLSLGMLTLSASAAGTEAQELEAKALWTLGLFKGYDTTGTNFGLSDSVKREQALTFLIRMLGEETSAQKWSGNHPFTDIPSGDWSVPYTGYAKKSGYTKGIGENKFGFSSTSKQREMVVFALRGLGYSDSGTSPDFTWDTAMAFAKGKGIVSSATEKSSFTRGDAVDIIFNALGVNVKGQSYDLLSKLMSMGVVTQAQYDAAMKIVENKPTSDLAAGSYTMTCQGKYLRVNSSKLEIRDTTPAQVFKVIAKDGYSYIQTEDGKYLTITSTKDGTQLTTSSTPYLWLIKKYSGSKYTIRPAAKTSLIVNACEQASANGTKMIVWTHPNSPANTLITITTATEKAVTASFNMYNKTGKTISELYIVDSSASKYGSEFLSSNKYDSFTNGKYISTEFTFYKDTSFDFFIRYSDGTEAEAKNLSFAKATSKGGTINIGSGSISLVSGSTTIATAGLITKGADLTAQTTQLKTRFNASVTKYNALLAECKKQGLDSDADFVKLINSVTTSINDIGKLLEGSTTLTAAQIKDCQTALDELDTFISQLDALLKAETAVTEKTITIYNYTGTTWTGLYSSSVLVDTWGSNLSAGTVTDKSSLKVIFSVTAAESKFDLKATYSGGEYIFAGLDLANVANNSTFFLYMNGTTPVISTTKPNLSREVSVTFVNNTNKVFTGLYSTLSTEQTYGTTNLLDGVNSDTIVIVFPVSDTGYLYDLKLEVTKDDYYEISKLDFSKAGTTATIELSMEGTSVVWKQTA